MKRMGIAALALLALAGLTTVVMAQDTLQLGTTEGTLSESTASYKLEATEGQVFVITLNSDDFDAYIEIRDADENYVTADDDSGLGTNAAVVFVAPSDGTFTVDARSYGGPTTGAYVMTVANEVTNLTIGTPSAAEIDGKGIVTYKFETDGSPLNIIADSGGEVDTNLTLFDVSGNRLDTAEDTNGVDPAFNSKVLLAGTYYLILAPYNADATGTTNVLVETTELKIIGETPTVITFDQTIQQDVVSFNVEVGKLYLIDVKASTEASLNFSLSALDPTNSGVYGYFSFAKAEGGSFLYRSEITGGVTAQLSGSAWAANSVDFTITSTEVKE